MLSNIFEIENGKTIYKVPSVNKPISGMVQVPGSKSITNRGLLLAALSKGTTTLTGVLFSDDSRHFLDSIIALGFNIDINEAAKEVTIQGLDGKIPVTEGQINVGSAGTASRFLTAMLAFSEGVYTINCSEQMKKRPMKPLFNALVTLGASFKYLEDEGHLPVVVTGNKGHCGTVELDISKSTQFLSALLMVGPMAKDGLQIKITSQKTKGAYIGITKKMIRQFGSCIDYKDKTYQVPYCHYRLTHNNNTSRSNQIYNIEPDMSAASYFFALATLTGGTICVLDTNKSSMQGDLKFLDVLENLGSRVTETADGIQVKGPIHGKYPGIHVDMNDFSDQTMTLAALAPYATSPTYISNVSHIKGQECDRMTGIINELTKAGIMCQADGNNIEIQPGPLQATTIETYQDHRFAMAFTLLGLRSENIKINNPMCCKKTFENYFQVLTKLLESNH